jgi:hypothetical protein
MGFAQRTPSIMPEGRTHFPTALGSKPLIFQKISGLALTVVLLFGQSAFASEARLEVGMPYMQARKI